MRENRMALNGAALAFKGAALAGLVVLVSGCASIHDHRGFQMDKALTDSVQPGVDNRMSVERALGQATFKSQFGPQSWYYVDRHPPEAVQAPAHDQRAGDEGQLRSGRQRQHGRPRDADPRADDPSGARSTPTLGRNRSFFQDLFGNIGSVGAMPGGTVGQGRGPTGSGPNGS
jgi:outer membrane protein assembly factor BamE (lipoprotein component of BamABCDE complex)